MPELRTLLMYEKGHGVTQDYDEALKWYRLAAEQENARGETNLVHLTRPGSVLMQSVQQ